MCTNHRWIGQISAVFVLSITFVAFSHAADPPNPFGTEPPKRKDAVYGAVCLSDGTFVRGQVYLTREHPLRIFDTTKEENRDVPLKAVKEIRCTIEKEWMEEEWRFKENANDEKVLTGQKYPARIYVHEIILAKGGTIKGTLSSVVYVEPEAVTAPQKNDGSEKQAEKSSEEKTPDESIRPMKPARFLLHHRDKGEPGEKLGKLVYVEKIVLGEEARKLKSPQTKDRKRDSASNKK